MSEEAIVRIPTPVPVVEPVVLEAEPEPLEIDLQRTALIVVDMQNIFVSKSCLFGLYGYDMSKSQEIIEPIKRMTDAARVKGCKVIYNAQRYSADLHESGGPNSPYWYKKALRSYREHPEWRDMILTRGTLGADIVKELQPQEGDILVEKPRISGLYGTNLDMILKTYNIKYLVFMGVATNTCVESTIRHAAHLDYFPILVSDAAAHTGPPFTQEATIFNVKNVWGWVTTTDNIINAMKS